MRKDLNSMLGDDYQTLPFVEELIKGASPHGAITQATRGREGSTKRTAES